LQNGSQYRWENPPQIVVFIVNEVILTSRGHGECIGRRNDRGMSLSREGVAVSNPHLTFEW
jgi:hypothetical protein